jgi:hypothetical protein
VTKGYYSLTIKAVALAAGLGLGLLFLHTQLAQILCGQPLQDRIVDVIVAESAAYRSSPKPRRPIGDPTRLVHVDEPPAGASEAEAHAFYEEQRRTLFGTL